MCQLMGITVSTCDFRTQPSGEKTSEINNMTEEEVIDGLKHRIQQKDPVFRKQFLSISKEPDVRSTKRNSGRYNAVRCGASFLPSSVSSILLAYTLHSLLLLIYFMVGKGLVAQ